MLTQVKARKRLAELTSARPRRLGAAAILLLLLAAAIAVVLVHTTSHRPIPGPPSLALYISSGTLPQHLTGVDPETLADPVHAPSFDLDVYGQWTVSADGSTIVAISETPAACPHRTGASQMILVRDLASGRLRSCFSAPTNVGIPRLSRDGSRLVVQGQGGAEPPIWYVFGTARARLLATAKASDQGPLGWNWSLIDAQARRLYWLVPQQAGVAGPGPLQIVAYDLTTGAESRQLTLTDVPTGVWQTGQDQNGAPSMAQLLPGAALSPDGRQLAIVHADGQAITLVDAQQLTVERTLRLAHPSSLVQRLLRLLPFAPKAAEAKELNGPALDAAYASDGRSLYIYGYEGTTDAQGQPDFRGIGLERIDLATGRIVATALASQQVYTILPAPDGHAIYVMGVGPTSGTEGAPPFLLQRLDATTLAVEAGRTFSSARSVILLPAKGSGH